MADEATRDEESATPGPGDSQLITDESPRGPRRRAAIRLGLLALLIGGLVLIAWLTGLTEYLTTDNVRAMMRESGPWGLLIFLVVFIIGNLVQIPSNVFIAAAIYSYGFAYGMPLSYTANIISVAVSFVLVRTIGGQPLQLVKRPWLRKLLDMLDERPVLAIMLMRIPMGGSPPLTYTLAMSEVRFRDYILGSMAGMIVPVTVVSAGLAWFWE